MSDITGAIGELVQGGLTARAVESPGQPVVGQSQANPDLLIYKTQTTADTYSWLLIPISVPFGWLMFAWQRRFGLYDHTVFVT
ncbi:MAG: hypothetical protein ABIT16_11100 [Croceibacterium sp.]